MNMFKGLARNMPSRPVMEQSFMARKVKQIVVSDYHRGNDIEATTITVALAAVFTPSMTAAAFWVVGSLQSNDKLSNEIYFTTKIKAMDFMAKLMVGPDVDCMEVAERNDRDLRMTYTQNGYQFPEQITLS